MSQKMTRRIFSTVAGLVVIGMGSATAQQPAPSVPAGNAKAGQALFMKIGCYQCHGNEGQGGAAGPRIDRSPCRSPTAPISAAPVKSSAITPIMFNPLFAAPKPLSKPDKFMLQMQHKLVQAS